MPLLYCLSLPTFVQPSGLTMMVKAIQVHMLQDPASKMISSLFSFNVFICAYYIMNLFLKDVWCMYYFLIICWYYELDLCGSCVAYIPDVSDR